MFALFALCCLFLLGTHRLTRIQTGHSPPVFAQRKARNKIPAVYESDATGTNEKRLYEDHVPLGICDTTNRTKGKHSPRNEKEIRFVEGNVGGTAADRAG